MFAQHPCKHEMLNLCWFDVGPPSATLDQHQTNTGSTSRVYWHEPKSRASALFWNNVLCRDQTQKIYILRSYSCDLSDDSTLYMCVTQQIRKADPILLNGCWAGVADGGPTSYQHYVNVSWLLEKVSFIDKFMMTVNDLRHVGTNMRDILLNKMALLSLVLLLHLDWLIYWCSDNLNQCFTITSGFIYS